MSNETPVPETTMAPEAAPETPVAPTAPTLRAGVVRACEIATGRAEADSAEEGTVITGALKDLNSKGNGPQWYRMVYRSGSWQYVSTERLPNGSFRASDRRASVSGTVYTGELVISHDRGSPMDAAWLICEPNAEGKVMVGITFASRRDRRITFTLPDGSVVVLANPRGK